ncbi:histidine phosphatase family protein [Roseomonas sp. GC11]|uniref:histidine phosphatase family protein n=1 Tax=Roseomonas sp. GC11 TaxID=2950546 RepID=UPI002108D417|nr:histidine phosphatase family protein [Roseomonas sp. GC11]MCQ4158833.1 histidine phosphatase family protein [Roseomonas sp. GC11]
MAAFALVRHGPIALPPGHCYGRLEVAPLPCPPPALPPALAGAPVFASPARRCRPLAEALAAGQPVRWDARLLELDFGAWEGQPWDAVPRAALDAWAADPWGFAPPGGESAAALVERIRAFRADLPERAIIIAHGGPLKVLAALLRGEEVDLFAPTQELGSLVFIENVLF